MKVEVNRAELINALKLVKPGLARRELIQQSTSFAFMGGYVITYNDELSIKHPINGLEDLRGAIAGQEFYALLDKVAAEDVEMEVDENVLIVKAGRVKSKFKLQEEITLPLEEVENKGKWLALPGQFIDGIKMTVYSCSRDVSSPAMTCINVTEDKMQASDNIRITEYDLDKATPNQPFLLPALAAVILMDYKITKIAKGLSNGWAHFKTPDGTEISCRLINATYPDATRALTIEDGKEVILPKMLKHALDRSEIFAKRDHSLDEEVTVTLAKKLITIKADNEAGQIEEKMKVTYDHDPVSFIIHPTFLRQVAGKQSMGLVGPNRMKFEGEGWRHIIALKAR